MAALTAAEIGALLARWPLDDDNLPPSVDAAFRGWKALTLAAIDPAIQRLNDDATVGFTTPAGAGFVKATKCRTLAAHGVSPPLGQPLSVNELRSMLPGNTAVGADSQLARQLSAMADQLQKAEATIASLVRQQAADEKDDVTADYEVNSTVVDALPSSFLALDPLSKKERLKISREYAGKYPENRWPNSLAMSDSTKNCKEMQGAKKLTLPLYAVEVAKFMDRTSTATKLVGTAWSRVLDVKADLAEQIELDPDIVFRGADLLDRMEQIEECLHGTFKISLDVATNMRLNVAHRVDVAMGIDHLRVDPLKKEIDDFISDDTYKLVESAAHKKQNLTWAKQGVFPGSKVGHFSQRPLSKSTGGGNQQSSGRGGRGRGNGRGRGKGGGGGKGRGGRGSGRGKSGKGGDAPPSGGD
jgi:hypothetical protein